MSEPIIRALRVEDAGDCHEIRTQPQVIWGTLQLPTLTLDDVRAQLGAATDVHRLGAEVDGKIVGTINLRVGCGTERQTGALGVTVHDAWQGRGLGKRLLSAMLDLADNWLNLHRVGLDVYTDNTRAIGLYEQFGFLREGITRSDVMRDGALVDLLHMGRIHPRATRPPQAEVAMIVEPARAPSLEGVRVRGARPEDVRAICRLFRQPSVLAGLGRLPSQHDDEVRKAFCPVPRGQHVFVAELNGEVIGMAHLVQFGGRRHHAGQIEALAVDPAWQGRGVGKALLQAVLDLSDRWIGLRKLLARVQAPDRAALALFQGSGFVAEATHREACFHNGAFTDAVVMGRINL